MTGDDWREAAPGGHQVDPMLVELSDSGLIDHQLLLRVYEPSLPNR